MAFARELTSPAVLQAACEGNNLMDAATLYTVITVASGAKRMTTEKYPTMPICEKVADELRKKAAIKDAVFYCVKRKPDDSERAAARSAAAAAAAAKRRAAAGAGAAAGQPKGAGPIGMPRDFFSGTTPPQQ